MKDEKKRTSPLAESFKKWLDKEEERRQEKWDVFWGYVMYGILGFIIIGLLYLFRGCSIGTYWGEMY